jgi:uncharacterized YigZ family protein
VSDGTARHPLATAHGELRVKGSRFLARVAPAASEEEALALVAESERAHRDATHHCWAWRLGWPAAERSSDAGEPAGTAGVPILRVLQGAGLTDVVAVVSRWFGGTKLGKGGLARAYAGATLEALEELTSARRRRRVRLELELPIAAVGRVQRLVQPPRVEILSEEYGRIARVALAVDLRDAERVREALAEARIPFTEEAL